MPCCADYVLHAKEDPLVELPSSQTNIHFSNNIKETDSINVLDFENVYNGPD
jgi:hypothetical protein